MKELRRKKGMKKEKTEVKKNMAVYAPPQSQTGWQELKTLITTL